MDSEQWKGHEQRLRGNTASPHHYSVWRVASAIAAVEKLTEGRKDWQ